MASAMDLALVFLTGNDKADLRCASREFAYDPRSLAVRLLEMTRRANMEQEDVEYWRDCAHRMERDLADMRARHEELRNRQGLVVGVDEMPDGQIRLVQHVFIQRGQ